MGGPNEAVVATGGGDGAVALWEDCTAQDAAEAAKEQQDAVLREQELLNALQVPRWLLRACLTPGLWAHGFIAFSAGWWVCRLHAAAPAAICMAPEFRFGRGIFRVRHSSSQREGFNIPCLCCCQ